MPTIQQFNSLCDAMIEFHRDQKDSCFTRAEAAVDQGTKTNDAIMREIGSRTLKAEEVRDKLAESMLVIRQMHTVQLMAIDEAMAHGRDMVKWASLKGGVMPGYA